jgi:hypothetical protein
MKAIIIEFALPALYHRPRLYGIIISLCTPITILGLKRICTQKGGRKNLEQYIINFGISILASVVAFYLCKWLDKHL